MTTSGAIAFNGRTWTSTFWGCAQRGDSGKTDKTQVPSTISKKQRTHRVSESAEPAERGRANGFLIAAFLPGVRVNTKTRMWPFLLPLFSFDKETHGIKPRQELWPSEISSTDPPHPSPGCRATSVCRCLVAGSAFDFKAVQHPLQGGEGHDLSRTPGLALRAAIDNDLCRDVRKQLGNTIQRSERVRRNRGTRLDLNRGGAAPGFKQHVAFQTLAVAKKEQV